MTMGAVARLVGAVFLGGLCLGVAPGAQAMDNGQCVNLDMKPIGPVFHSPAVCLGIRLDADLPWDSLGEAQKKEWAAYVDLSIPNVTPPYPLPNARALLNRITVPDEVKKQPQSLESDPVTRVNVHIDEHGKVTKVDVLIKNGEIESMLFAAAILGTEFSPAKAGGQPAPSSIILELHRPFHFADRGSAK